MTARVDEQAVALFRAWIASLPPLNTFVREWTMADLLPAMDELDAGRSVEAGKTAFRKVGCAQCHRFAGEGGAMGPDLTDVGRRLLKRELLEAIQELHRGGSPMSTQIARRVVASLHQSKPPAQEAALTERETEILAHLAKGYSNKEIANLLNLSLETVRTHLRHVYEKLHVHSRTEALARYFEK